MALWFETKLKYEKMNENGVMAKVSESYLVDALSFTEAETKIIANRTPHVGGSFSVTAVRKTKISEIFNPGSEKFYLVKVGFITTDSITGADKRTVSEILIGAKDFEDALKEFFKGMEGTLADYEIISLAESPIIEIVR